MALSRHQCRKFAKQKRALALKTAESSTGASGVTDSPAPLQASGESDSLQTAFLPELLSPAEFEKQHAAGKVDLVDKIKNRWLEIQAVKDRYPVSRGMLERIAHETIQTMLLPSTPTRDKLIAAKLLMSMAYGNQPNKGLPPQVEVNINNNPLDMRRIIDAVLNDDSIGILDNRESKIIPGSADDYAE